MRRSFITLLALSGLLLTAPRLMAQHDEHQGAGDAPGKGHAKMAHAKAEDGIDSRTVKGEVIDITCYVRHDSKGAEHIKCATVCANLGMPLGVLEDETENVYLIIPSGHEDPKKAVMPFLGKKVKIDAILYTMGGLTGLEIESISEVKP